MAVVVLMYHHTPQGAPEGFYDVALSTFRDQIRALHRRRRFVHPVPRLRARRICRARRPCRAHLRRRPRQQRGGVPLPRRLRPYVDGFRRARLVDARRALSLRPRARRSQGRRRARRPRREPSRAHLALRRRTRRRTRRQPRLCRGHRRRAGGRNGAARRPRGGRELAAAARAGFRLVGNSRPLPHRRIGLSVNRICINRTHDARAPLRLAQAGALHWGMVGARFAAARVGRRLKGAKLYGALVAIAK